MIYQYSVWIFSEFGIWLLGKSKIKVETSAFRTSSVGHMCASPALLCCNTFPKGWVKFTTPGILAKNLAGEKSGDGINDQARMLIWLGKRKRGRHYGVEHYPMANNLHSAGYTQSQEKEGHIKNVTCGARHLPGRRMQDWTPCRFSSSSCLHLRAIAYPKQLTPSAPRIFPKRPARPY